MTATIWPAPTEAMAEADRHLRREHGGMTYPTVMLNIAEYQAREGRDGYRWDGEASFGGDIDRFVLKSEGEGTFGEPLEQAEVQQPVGLMALLGRPGPVPVVEYPKGGEVVG